MYLRGTYFQRIKTGFTLLELLISISILLLVWGSTGTLLTQVSFLMKRIISQTRSHPVRVALSRFEMDIHSLLGDLKGEGERMKFLALREEVSYEFLEGRVYRVGRFKEEMLRDITRCRWMYLSEGKWADTWTQGKFPEAVLWQLEMGGEFVEMLYPLQVED